MPQGPYEREPESAIGAGFGRRVPGATGRTLVAGAAAKAPAAIHACRTARGPHGIDNRAADVGTVPVPAPLPDIPGHVVQAPVIRELARDGAGAADRAGPGLESLALVAIGAVPDVPGDRVERFGIDRRGRSRARRVFPLRLGRQGVLV